LASAYRGDRCGTSRDVRGWYVKMCHGEAGRAHQLHNGRENC
jgi:hypothetical protein